MKTLFAVIFAMLVSLGTPAFAQNNNTTSIILGGINAGVNVHTNTTYGKVAIDTNRTNERINDRQADSWDRQTASNERIALERERTERMRSGDELEARRLEISARVWETTTREDRSGSVTARDGRITAQLDPRDRPLPKERRDEGNYSGPRVR